MAMSHRSPSHWLPTAIRVSATASRSAGEYAFTLDTPHNRLRALAFARLLGHLLGDGSISAAGQGHMHVGQAVDREAVLNDIELLTGKRPAATQYDERKWVIVLPSRLTEAVVALAGVRVGRRIDQPPRLPRHRGTGRRQCR